MERLNNACNIELRENNIKCEKYVKLKMKSFIYNKIKWRI